MLNRARKQASIFANCENALCNTPDPLFYGLAAMLQHPPFMEHEGAHRNAHRRPHRETRPGLTEVKSVMRSVSFFLLALSCGLFAQTPIQLHVDATDAPRRVFHVQMTMPAQPGPMTLLYPQWIPGEHGPTGPVVNLVGLKILGGGKTIAWKRDSVNLYAFAFEVPAGVSSLDIAFDYIAPPESEGFTSGASTTSELAVLNWNQVLLYPKGADADSMQLQTSLKVPSGWRYGTALPIQRETGNDVEFKPASLTTLIDSPISAGAHYRTIDLGEDLGAPHYLHLAADSDRALEISPELIDQYKNLVKETGALFGSRHYRSYHFLYTLSDHVAHFGLEHHESSDDRYDERTLIDPEVQKISATCCRTSSHTPGTASTAGPRASSPEATMAATTFP